MRLEKESQNIEFKEIWKKEYIKWISAFANSEGGKLYIGVSDRGEVVGVVDIIKLQTDIPNSVQNKLGVIIAMNLLRHNEFEYLEIVVDKYPYPVSYSGSYYVRSGSTTQELKGASLDKFLLKKQGVKSIPSSFF